MLPLFILPPFTLQAFMLMHGSGGLLSKKNPGKEFQERDYAETNSRKGVLRKSSRENTG